MSESNALLKTSAIERLRKPVSRFFMVLWLLAVIFTVPPELGEGWRAVVKLAGFLLLIIAALGRIWSLAYIAGRKTVELCTDGPYSLTRNPLYLFSFAGAVGLGLALQNLMLTLIATVTFLAYYAAVIRSEEGRLRTVHGAAFGDYCARVPRFWPRSLSPTGAAKLELNVASFTRGMREMFWFLAAIIAADALELAHLRQLWPTYSLPF